MLRLQENEVIYNNSINLGDVLNLHYTEGVLTAILPDGVAVCIPEVSCTESEKEIFEKIKGLDKASHFGRNAEESQAPKPSSKMLDNVTGFIKKIFG